MTDSLKERLVDLLTKLNLDDVPEKRRSEISEAVETLKNHSGRFEFTTENQEKAESIIAYLFNRFPELLAKNDALLPVDLSPTSDHQKNKYKKL